MAMANRISRQREAIGASIRRHLLPGLVMIGFAVSPGAAQSSNLLPAETAGASAELPAALPTAEDARLKDSLIKKIRDNPVSSELLAALGALSFRTGDYYNAAVAYKRADALKPLDDSGRFTMAMAFIRVGHPEWARAEIERLAEGQPQNSLYHYWLGRLDFAERKYADALAHLREALRIDPEFVRAHDRVGLCFQGMGEWESAIESHREAVRLNRTATPKSPWPPTNLGILLYQLGRLDEAEPLLREALGYDETSSHAHYQLGVLLEKRDELTEAITHLERAAALDSSDAKPHYALTRLYRRLGEAEKARAALERFGEIQKLAEDDSGRP